MISQYVKNNYFTLNFTKQQSQYSDKSISTVSTFPDEDTIDKISVHSSNLSNFMLLKVCDETHNQKIAIFREKKTSQLYYIKILKKFTQIHSLQYPNTIIGLYHPFILPLRYAWQTEKRMYLGLDYCLGGDLSTLLQKKRVFSEEQCCFYSAQVFLAFECLHKNSIIFKDLKTDNILLDSSGYIKLTDFCFNKNNFFKEEKENNKDKNYSIYIEYLAPEAYTNNQITQSTDWWTFGCLIYEMLVGLPPFYSSNKQECYNKILQNQLVIPDYLSESVRNLLKNLLNPNPHFRLDSNQIKEHSWFKQINWSGLLNKKIKAPFIPKQIKYDTMLSEEDMEYTETPQTTFKVSLEQTDSYQSSDIDRDSYHNLPSFTKTNLKMQKQSDGYIQIIEENS